MGIAKRQALLHEVVREVRGRGEPELRGLPHARRVWLHRAHDTADGPQAVLERIHGVEQRLLVLLVVLVVGERLAFHQHQQAGQVADDAPGLAAHQFGHVGIFLLRHDAGTRAERIWKFHEAELLGGPYHHLLAPARQVRRGDGGARAELDGEVAIAHRIEGVRGDAVEAERVCGIGAVYGKRRPRQRRRAERRDIHARATLAEPLAVAVGHFEPGQQMVAECHRLGCLQVREAGHRVGAVAFRQRNDAAHDLGQ